MSKCGVKNNFFSHTWPNAHFENPCTFYERIYKGITLNWRDASDTICQVVSLITFNSSCGFCYVMSRRDVGLTIDLCMHA